MSDHDHDLDYAEKHHRHYDLEQEMRDLQTQIADLWERINELPGAI